MEMERKLGSDQQGKEEGTRSRRQGRQLLPSEGSSGVNGPRMREREGSAGKSAGLDVRWNWIGAGGALWAPLMRRQIFPFRDLARGLAFQRAMFVRIMQDIQEALRPVL